MTMREAIAAKLQEIAGSDSTTWLEDADEIIRRIIEVGPSEEMFLAWKSIEIGASTRGYLRKEWRAMWETEVGK